MKKFKNWRHADGFTLVELIVVIAILAILGGVAVPAYSGYVAKAERAADEALLAEVNLAFASACAMNGESHINRTKAALNVETMTLDTDNDAIDSSFGTFFDVNGEFKTVDALAYNKPLGMFEMTVSYQLADGSKITISESDAAKIKNSVWAEMGSEHVLNMIAAGTDVVGATNTFQQLMADGSFETAAEELGLDYDAMVEEYTLNYYKNNVKADYDPSNPKQLGAFNTWKNENLNSMESEVSQNLMAVIASQKGEEASKTVIGILTSENAYGTLQGNVSTGDFGMGMAENALAFGLYTAYAGKEATFNDMKTALQDPTSDDYKNFMNYLNNADNSGKVNEDMDSLLAAMNIISSQDSNTLHNATVSGLNNQELQDVLGSVFGEK